MCVIESTLILHEGRKSTKKYLRELISETQTGNDGYPQYRRRNSNDGGHTTIIKVKNVDIERTPGNN